MRDVTYPPIIATAKVAFRALGHRFQMTGTEHVPREGGVLLAFNHVFAGLEAYVGAHLADFPGDLQIRAIPGGVGASVSVPLRLR